MHNDTKDSQAIDVLGLKHISAGIKLELTAYWTQSAAGGISYMMSGLPCIAFLCWFGRIETHYLNISTISEFHLS